MVKHRHIYLIGLSGSGKSSVGKIFAKEFKRSFVDIDKMIEKNAKKSITQIFEQDGEPAFRKMEAKTLQKLARKSSEPKVIALGGGTFDSPANRKLAAASGISIWLRCPINELSSRLKSISDRPLLKGSNPERQLSAQLRKRLRNYRKADLHISTSQMTPGQVSIEIIKTLKKKYAAD